MPPINKYKCNFCDFSFPDGWGGYFYVEVDEELIMNRIHKLEDQLSALHQNLAKIKSCAVETERVLSKFMEHVEIEFGKRILPQFRETIQQVRKDSPVRRLEEIENEIERMWNSWLRTIEDVRASMYAFLEKIEGSLREGERVLEQQIYDLKKIEIRLRSEGSRSIRVRCPHPCESDYAMEILGRVSPDEYISRTGFNSYVVCLDCLHQFEADFRDEKVNEWRLWYGRPSFKEAFRGKPEMKDERKCPKCGSRNVKTVFEMIGEKCPKCKKGTIEEIETGTMA